jgi:hypothetical protein
MTELPDDIQPQTTTSGAPAEDDQGAALARAGEAIDEARGAEGDVAAHDDITSRDDARAGQHSEDPDGEGGHP